VSAPVSRPLAQPRGLGRLWWLPANGEGNGLDDGAWAPIADVSAALVAPLLAAFRAVGVPAYAAPAGRPLTRPAPTRRPRHRTRASRSQVGQPQRRALAAEIYHIWVGTSAYGRAEEVLRIALPRLQRREEA
jgi:hypothetical protein